ncbi:kinesin-like protein KIN-14E isoform X2 [Oryza glaberrima]|uniref:kinesin-like protein KIN-14E isoform X2 n=1 Tax=Oryza glaberrima TaxID=4538 RepID=UPI00224BFC83|nr:kinesin-like protein KIN-14E isoform X2 [Oryza glaberrima]
MEGEEERCPGEPTPMDFSWTTGWEKAAADDDEAESAPAPAPPAPSPQEAAESMILVPGPRVVLSGLMRGDCRADDSVLFINAGGSATEGCEPSSKLSEDSFFEGGDAIETSEDIVEGGDYPSLYHSARYGNFSYKIDGLAPGDYFLDLHFAEIVNTYGPKGIRAFDVLVQEEKILSELDVYAVVGGNRPLQVRDIRVTVESDGAIVINFKGVRGSPMVCGICIRKRVAIAVTDMVTEGNVLCKRCSAHTGNSPLQTRTSKLISKYEKQIEELTNQCNMKSDECYMAWSSVESTNQELERLKIELHQKVMQSDNIEQVIDRQADQLRSVSQKYENAKKLWAAAISNLENKIKAMKQEQTLLSLEAHDCANAVPDLSKMIGAVQTLVAQCEDLKLKYYEEMAKRKKLHNIVEETKGNIRVFCRCRPLIKDETSSGYKCAVDFDGAKDGDIAIVNGGAAKKTFKFDRVYMPTDNQADVYADASPLVTSVLDGYNVCIFAYGQTGTGKTFTMEGTERNRGVNYRTLEELFKIAEERKETVTYSISVSVLEVYNEQIRDLLASSPSSKKLEIKQASEGSHHVPGIVEAKVENIKEVWDVLQAGSNARAVGSNNVNEHSSRSHCMLCIMVRAENLMNGECTRSKLWLVDLAGSERLAKTDVQGERLKEAQNINRSLSALGDVISALATKNSHIPYRNSKLTHLLQDSLGGDSKALMFVQISPSNNDVSETLSSLNFASRVRRIELGPAKKQVDTAELQKVKQMLERAKQDIRLKDDSLRKLEDNCQNLENKAKGKEQFYKNLQEKVKELESQLDSKMHSQITSEKQQNELFGKLKEKEEMCTTLQQKIAEESEHKLRLQQQSESEIKELELKLKEQEHHRSVAESKAMEIGQELLETQRTEAMLQIKPRDLENNLQERTTLQDTNMILDSTNCMRVASTPGEAKAHLLTREEAMSEKEQHILRSSDSMNKKVTNNSSIVGAPEVVNEKKRKGDARNSSIGGELENQPVGSQNASRKRSLQGEPRLKRKSTEPLKNPGRVTATSKTAAATHKTGPVTRATRQQPAVNKTRGWVR